MLACVFHITDLRFKTYRLGRRRALQSAAMVKPRLEPCRPRASLRKLVLQALKYGPIDISIAVDQAGDDVNPFLDLVGRDFSAGGHKALLAGAGPIDSLLRCGPLGPRPDKLGLAVVFEERRPDGFGEARIVKKDRKISLRAFVPPASAQ